MRHGAIVAALIAWAAQAEEPPVRNSVYVELLGSAPVVSLNYERRLSDGLMVRVGVGYLRATGFTGGSLDRVQLPFVAGYLFDSGTHHFELGIGAVLGIRTSADAPQRVEVPVTAVLGYRYAPPGGGVNFRAALTPLVDFWDSSWQGLPVVPLIGIAFGYGF